MKAQSAMLLAGLAFMLGCGSSATTPTQIPDTPEGAVLRLEEAYRKWDVAAACACRSFQYEGEMLQKRADEAAKPAAAGKEGNDKNGNDKEGSAKEGGAKTPPPADELRTAALFAGQLEFKFKEHIQQRGFPNFIGVTSTFTDQKVGDDGIVTLTEVCKYPDGHTTTQQVQTVKTVQGWKVFVPPPLD